MAAPWHTRSLPDIEQEFETDLRTGLSVAEAARRLATAGPNVLPEGKAESLVLVFFRQFLSPLIGILVLAAGAILILGNVEDAIVIAVVLVFNAVIGTVQEGRAARTLRALRRFVETTAIVIRDGAEAIVSDAVLVPGDLIVLREGMKVPADARLATATNLRIDESALTGESISVHKEDVVCADPALPVASRNNMVFMGTNVLAGIGLAVTVATGERSVVGGVSRAIGTVDTEIPLKKDVRALTRVIILLVAAMSVVLFAVGLASGVPVREMLAVVVSLAVSVIPEGLPVVLTLILATGVWRMAKRNALVKKLQAVEALGQAQVLAVDKTGTLTQNQMIVRQLWIGGARFDIGGAGYAPQGDIVHEGGAVAVASHPELLAAGKAAAFCATGTAARDEAAGTWRVSGDPTEVALGVFAEKTGFRSEELAREYPLLAEMPFDYREKYHMTVHGGEGLRFVAVGGAPEAILARSTKMVIPGGGTVALTPERREEASKAFHELSREGLRVVGIAYRELPASHRGSSVVAESLTLAAWLGIEDSLRPEVPDAVRAVRAAGVRLVMITGDHRLTALAIAKQAGIWREGDEVITGEDIEQLSESALDRRLDRTTVFARVTPEHKLAIVRAYRRRGEVIAMTGDGVNDAPSLVAADLGVAMGMIGTEVTKEAADIVLLDDNFGTITAAIEEGRAMYRTIKKSIFFLFSTSVGEVFAVAGAFFVGLPLPLLAPQILWMNLVTDPFLGSALAMEPNDPGLLARPPERGRRAIVDRAMLLRSAFLGLVMAAGTLWIFSAYLDHDLARARTIALTALAIFQWLNAWNARSDRASAITGRPFANHFLIFATLGCLALQLAAVYLPFLRDVLGTVPLTALDWVAATSVALTVVFAEEIRKGVVRWRS